MLFKKNLIKTTGSKIPNYFDWGYTNSGINFTIFTTMAAGFIVKIVE
jgi:hypothetical protein